MQASTPLGISVAAFHVHHGLSPNADDWAEHCAAQCRAWAEAGHDLVFDAKRLQGGPGQGESVEAWARRGRYGALRTMALAHGANLVLLGHHQRDQAETFLLQALRGGGMAGLAAMPRRAEREGLSWVRPWIDVPAEAIDAYARRHGLRWIEDESNADGRFARNRLRQQVWPALVAAFPDAARSLSTSARWAHEAVLVNEDSATADLSAVSGLGGLAIVRWKALPPARQRNALRAFLRAATQRPVPATLVDRLCIELEPEATRTWPVLEGALRSARGVLSWVPKAGARAVQKGGDVVLDASAPGRYRAGAWPGELVVATVRSGGISPALASCLELTSRRAGDRFQGQANRPARSLKLQYQAAAVSAFDRTGPVVRSAGRVVFVPGLGIDASALAEPGKHQLSLVWEAAAMPTSAG